MNQFKKIVLILLVIILVVSLGFLSFNYIRALTNKKQNPVVSMEIEGYGTIKIELYPDMAPNTVKNFIRLSQRGFYNGKTFSEIGDSYIKGGLDLTEVPEDSEEEVLIGPKLSDIKDLGDGEEDASYAIEGEFVDNDADENTLNHERGIISMARTDYSDYQEEIAMMQMLGDYDSVISNIVDRMYDSATSGFFILTETDTSYNGLYAGFGRVIEGMDIVDQISNLETTQNEDGENVPNSQPVIKNVTVETYGVDYGIPDTIEVFDFDSIFDLFLSNYASAQ